MFYSNQLLARKAPLGQIWMAATMHPKFNRRKLNKLDIVKICEQILYPSVPMALRLSGILMGGVVIVYERKVKLLYDDVTRLMLEINEAWRVKPVADPTVLPKGKTQAKYKAVTLPAHNMDEEMESTQFNLGSPTIARFQCMQLDDLEEPYFCVNIEEDYSNSHHQADKENITLVNDLDSSMGQAVPYNHFERFDIEEEEEPQFNCTSEEQPQVPSTLVPSPLFREGVEQEMEGIKDHMEEQHVEGGGSEVRPISEAQVVEQEDKKRKPMKRKGRPNATRVVVDDGPLMIPGNIYQSWLHETSDIVSKRGIKMEDFHKRRSVFRFTNISDLMELPLVPLIPGLENFSDVVQYPALFMDLLKNGAQKQTVQASSSGGKFSEQPQDPVSHSPPEELHHADLPDSVDPREMARPIQNNLNERAWTPGSSGHSANSIPSSGSGHSLLNIEPDNQLPGTKRKQNYASSNNLGSLDPIEEDVPMRQAPIDFNFEAVPEDVPTSLEHMEETGPTQTPLPKSSDPKIDKITQSIRTHLKVHFDAPGAPEFESLDQLSLGMNRKKAAQLFYQTCVLATHDYVKVQQTVPYGEITISKGPRM